jgi:hypothetical protein
MESDDGDVCEGPTKVGSSERGVGDEDVGNEDVGDEGVGNKGGGDRGVGDKKENEAASLPRRSSSRSTPLSVSNPLGPFPNLCSFQLGEWFINRGDQSSVQTLQTLVTMAQTPGFAQDIAEANWPKIFRHLVGECTGGQLEDEVDWVDDGWKTTPVSISVPLGKSTTTRITGTLYHRSIVAIIRKKVASDSDMRLFHYEPFEVIWQPDPSLPAQRIYSELYHSEAFLKTHQEIQDAPSSFGSKYPPVVIGLMFWSDGTHLTSFSSEKLWPGYMSFANESKHRRGRPSQNLCHHIAFFDDVSLCLGLPTNTVHLLSSANPIACGRVQRSHHKQDFRRKHPRQIDTFLYSRNASCPMGNHPE